MPRVIQVEALLRIEWFSVQPVLVVGGVAAYGFGYLGTKGSIDAATEAAETIPGQDGVEQSQVKIDPATTDPDIFATQDYGLVLNGVLPILEDKRDSSLRKMNEILRSGNRNAVPDVASADARIPNNKIGQQINRDIAADVFTASTEKNTTLGKNLLAGIFRPGSYAGPCPRVVDTGFVVRRLRAA